MPLINERAAAAYLGVSVAFLRADRSRGHVGGRTPGPPWYRVGRAVRYDLRDLEQWLATRRVDRSRRNPRPTAEEARRASPEARGQRRPAPAGGAGSPWTALKPTRSGASRASGEGRGGSSTAQRPLDGTDVGASGPRGTRTSAVARDE